jgi:hypothetical protein
MRALVIATFLSSLAPADNTPPPSDKGFALELTWVRQETSRDSNSQTESWTLKGDQLSWKWAYGGYHPSRDFVRNKHKTVKVKDPSSLVALVGKLAETREVALGKNPRQTLTVTLQVTRGGKTTKLTATGFPPDNPPEDWKALEQLRSALETLVGD